MTSMSMTWKVKNYPFLLLPSGKDYLWGGNKLKKEYNKKIDMEPLAETWECSTHKDGPSFINSGVYKGKKLVEVLKEHPEFIGTHPIGKETLPILVKLIDAQKDLSVQVHPNDEYASKYENGQLGKTEMWYVLEAKENAKLIYGFNINTNKELLQKSVKDGTIVKYLNTVPVKKGDIFYIKPGTVHAICEGIIVAEVQENSNLTYRLYDYNRLDKNGKTRPLHIDKGLDVINYKATNEVRQPMRVYNYKNGYASELICRCKYFEIHREIINTAKKEEKYKFSTDINSFHVLLCINGQGKLIMDKENIDFIKGDCIFIPANSIQIEIDGDAEFLNINC